MTTVEQLLSTTEVISVSQNRRFPSDGEPYFCARSDHWKFGNTFLHHIYRDLDGVYGDWGCIEYEQLKGIVFPKCTQFIQNNGWRQAYTDYSDIPRTTPEMRLLNYLWILCCMSNLEESNDYWEGVYNVDSFERKSSYTWRK